MSSPLPSALETRGAAGARLSSPSAARNRAVIAQELAGLLPRRARVLEIASGTGEHALACIDARPDLVWTPSDPDPDARASIDAWASQAAGAIRAALDLDVTQDGWQNGLEADAIFCANMIHIAPWAAAEGLFSGASAILASGAPLHLYGPFLEGESTAPSNLDFDASLRARHPGWGVRAMADVDALAGRCGFARIGRLELPANNRLLSYQRSAS